MKTSIFLFTLCFCPAYFSGQTDSTVQARGKEESAHKVTVNTNPVSQWISSVSSVSLTSEKGENDITGTVAVNLKKLNTFLNITVNTPFDGTKTEGLNLEGLANGTSLGIAFEHECWKLATVKYSAVDLSNAFDAINEQREKDNKEKGSGEHCCYQVKDANVNKYTSLTDEEKEKFMDLLHLKFYLPFWGVGYKLGRTDFDFFDDTTLITYSKGKTYYSNEIRAFGGVKFSPRSSLGLSFGVKYYFDAGDIQTYNVPVRSSTSSVTEQLSLYPSSPQLKEKATLQLEYRQFFPNGKLAVNPTLNTELINKTAELRIQFYFLTLKEDDKVKGLNGGIFAGYKTGNDYKMDSENGKFLVGVFFSGLFDVNRY